MTSLDVFERLLENILAGDQVEAAYTLRMFADEIEETGVPPRDEIIRYMGIVLGNELDEEEEYTPRRRTMRTPTFEDYEGGRDDCTNLFDEIEDLED